MVSTPNSIGGEPIDATNPMVIDYEQRRRDLEQLAEARADMVDAIGYSVRWLLDMERGGMLRKAEDMERAPFGVVEAVAQARQPLTYTPGRLDGGALQPDQVGWGELARLTDHTPEEARELWFAIKDAARRELATGTRAANALEGPMPSHDQPWHRAQYLAIVDALVADLKPRGALEQLMIQRMASAYTLILRWQQEAINREELEEWQGDSTMRQEHAGMSEREKERNRLNHGYLPPRQKQAEAIADAYLMVDRLERAFLRLVREFRNQRRMFANLIVAADTVNIADGGPQQVNISQYPLDDGEASSSKLS